jgi:hypothetical protein
MKGRGRLIPDPAELAALTRVPVQHLAEGEPTADQVRRHLAEVEAQHLRRVLQGPAAEQLPRRSLKALVEVLKAMTLQLADLAGATADAMARLDGKPACRGRQKGQ